MFENLFILIEYSDAVSTTNAFNLDSSHLPVAALISMSAVLLFIFIIALFPLLYVLQQRAGEKRNILLKQAH